MNNSFMSFVIAMSLGSGIANVFHAFEEDATPYVCTAKHVKGNPGFGVTVKGQKLQCMSRYDWKHRNG